MAPSLLPKEHGAYGQLLFPVLSGLLLRRPGAAAIALSVAAILFFLAYEPFAVLTGVRGTRAQRNEKMAAARRLALLLPPAAAAGAAGILLAPQEARWLVLLPLLPGLLLVPLIALRRAKSLGGELVVIAAFSSLHVAVGGAAGLSGVALWGPAVVWALVFILSTFAVHAIKERQSGSRSVLTAVSDGLCMIGLLAGIVLASKTADVRWLAIAALAPIIALVVVNFGRVTARHLKRIGWSLVAADLVALVVMAIAH